MHFIQSILRGRRLLTLGILLSLGVTTGCGVKTYPVEGMVRFSDGKPATELAKGLVSFESLDGTRSAEGEIQADASYRLRSFEGVPGLAAGDYRVLVLPRPPGEKEAAPRQVMARRFESFKTSGIQVTVKPELNQIPLTVERP